MADEKEVEKTGYMCRIEFDHELGWAEGGNKIYPSIQNLYRHHPMSHECGIIKVSIRKLEVVEKGTMCEKKERI